MNMIFSVVSYGKPYLIIIISMDWFKAPALQALQVPPPSRDSPRTSESGNNFGVPRRWNGSLRQEETTLQITMGSPNRSQTRGVYDCFNHMSGNVEIGPVCKRFTY